MTTIKTIVPNYPRAFTKNVDTAIEQARDIANKTGCNQVVFEGYAYGWYGFMTAELWKTLVGDELCCISIVKPRELENNKRREIVKRIEELDLSMEQLYKLQDFMETL